MVITDSLQLYERACQEAKRYSQVPSNYNVGGNNYYNAGYCNMNVDFESYYIEIIGAMFYELITKKCSSLLSHLCVLNGIHVNLANIQIDDRQNTSIPHGAFDIKPILDGLNAAFSKDLGSCSSLYNTNKDNVFQGRVFNKEFDYIDWVNNALQELDRNMARILSNEIPGEDSKSKQQEESGFPKETKKADTIFRTHEPAFSDKLNQYADKRRADDAKLSEQIQQLQVSLQDELKQIMAIRDGIDYNNTQEAISQLLALYSLLYETLQYHPNKKNKESYNNLIESCEDLLENIEQSIAMLGVTIINDPGKPFDSGRHKAIKGSQPTGTSIVSRVVKIGFAYNKKVLEKAEVEIG